MTRPRPNSEKIEACADMFVSEGMEPAAAMARARSLSRQRVHQILKRGPLKPRRPASKSKIALRLSDEEYAAIKEAALKSGAKVEAWVRGLAMAAANGKVER